MERIYRNLNDATKLRISQKLKGRSMSDSHKQAISDAMKAYWATIPYRPTENNEANIRFYKIKKEKEKARTYIWMPRIFRVRIRKRSKKVLL